MLPGFDNESVAISAMCCSFFFWCRALRSPKSWPIAGLAGHLGAHEMDFKTGNFMEFHKDQNWTQINQCLWSMDRMHIVPFWVRSWNVLFYCFDACARLAYSYMAASWGGYVFVLPLGRLAERCCWLLLHKEWWPALFSMVSSLSESWRNTQLER